MGKPEDIMTYEVIENIKQCDNCKCVERKGNQIQYFYTNQMEYLTNKTDKNIELYLVDCYSNPFYLCEKCLKVQLRNENEDNESIQQEIQDLQNKLSQVQQQISNISERIEDDKYYQQQLSESNQEQQEVDELNKMKQTLSQQFDKLQEQVLQFEIRESKYWDEVNVFEKRLQTLLDKKQIAEKIEQYYNDKLNKLNKFNTLNSVFFIELSEQVGLINNLMIGKKINEEINWDETNAGLGQVTLLFLYLITKYEYQMKAIKEIDACGNDSSIVELNKSDQLFLKGPFNKTEEVKFNRAMKLILDEFFQFFEYLSQSVLINYIQNIKLPFKIDVSNSTIDGISITTQELSNAQYQGLDNWTLAFKKLLINFKYIISINALYDSQKEIELFDLE